VPDVVRDHELETRARSAWILDRLVQRACRIVDGDSSMIVMRDRQDPRVCVCIEAHNGSAIGERFPADTGVPGEVFRAGGPVLVTNGAFNVVAVPIRWGDAARAVLQVSTADPHRTFGSVDVAALRELGEFAAVLLENTEMHERLETVLQTGVRALARAVDLHDRRTGERSEHVVQLAVDVGTQLGLAGRGLVELEFAARLHDLGKLGVPEEILAKPGALSDAEWAIVEHHPVWAAEMLLAIPGLEAVAAIVEAVHERWDGLGYPQGLASHEIPLASRVIFVCDAYRAMVSERPYRQAIDPSAAVAELQTCAGSQFDPDVVRALAELLAGQGIAVTDQLRLRLD
jgi:HD domain